MSLFIDILDGGPAIKRGDLVQSNVGDRRERTWIVLRAVRMKRRESGAVPRFWVWMVRWWELEPEMRRRLYESAERNGGQGILNLRRYPQKKKKSFDDLMKRGGNHGTSTSEV